MHRTSPRNESKRGTDGPSSGTNGRGLTTMRRVALSNCSGIAPSWPSKRVFLTCAPEIDLVAATSGAQAKRTPRECGRRCRCLSCRHAHRHHNTRRQSMRARPQSRAHDDARHGSGASSAHAPSSCSPCWMMTTLSASCVALAPPNTELMPSGMRSPSCAAQRNATSSIRLQQRPIRWEIRAHLARMDDQRHVHVVPRGELRRGATSVAGRRRSEDARTKPS